MERARAHPMAKRTLKHFPRRLQTLQWRFLLSYMVVTVLTVLALPTISMMLGFISLVRTPDLPQQVASGLGPTFSQTVVLYLIRDPIDRVGLENWLLDAVADGQVKGVWLSGSPSGTSQMAVMDASGHVIATTSSSTMPMDTLLMPQLTVPQQRVLHAALSGDESPRDLATPEMHGRSLIAVPIKASGRVIGVLALDLDVGAIPTTYLLRSARYLLGVSLVLTAVTAPIGLIFGFVISHGMVRRLRRITRAVDTWSHGDFSTTVHDRSADELGQLARDLDQMADEVRSLLESRQQLAVVEERNRLARDLHDSVKQQLFAAGMQVAAAHSLAERDLAAAKTHLAEAEQLIDRTKKELSVLIHELRPTALGDQGLVPALRELGDDWARSSGIIVVVRAQGEQATPLDVEQALFRVAQEALSNVTRHSDATTVDVRVAWDGDVVTLAITDDGHGFDAALRSGKGVGLASMTERVESLGGTLLVSSDTTGTRVEAHVPIPGPDQRDPTDRAIEEGVGG